MSGHFHNGNAAPPSTDTVQQNNGNYISQGAARLGIPPTQMFRSAVLQPVPLWQLRQIPGGRQFHQVAPPALLPAAPSQGITPSPLVAHQPFFAVQQSPTGNPTFQAPRSANSSLSIAQHQMPLTTLMSQPTMPPLRPMVVLPTPFMPPSQYVNSAGQVVILRGATPSALPMTNLAPVFQFPPPPTRSGMSGHVQMIPILLPGTPTTLYSTTPGNPAIRRPSHGDLPPEDIIRPSNPATPTNYRKPQDRVRKLPLARQLNVTINEVPRAPFFRRMNRSLPQILETLPGGEVSLTRSQRLHLEWELSPIGSTDSTTCYQDESSLSDILEQSEAESPSNYKQIQF